VNKKRKLLRPGSLVSDETYCRKINEQLAAAQARLRLTPSIGIIVRLYGNGKASYVHWIIGRRTEERDTYKNEVWILTDLDVIR
jgi:hypothetical protein